MAAQNVARGVHRCQQVSDIGVPLRIRGRHPYRFKVRESRIKVTLQILKATGGGRKLAIHSTLQFPRFGGACAGQGLQTNIQEYDFKTDNGQAIGRMKIRLAGQG